MKKGKSIVMKQSLFTSLVLAVIVALTYIIMIAVSREVLRNNARDFLISTVEQNVNLVRLTDSEEDKNDHVYFPYGEGFVEVDTDFLKNVSTVYAAVYTDMGELIYGETPVYIDRAFSDTYTYDISYGRTDYRIYDRKLNITGDIPGSLWIRGVVSDNESRTEMDRITRISLLIIMPLAILSVIAGYMLQRKLLKPLKDMEETAGEIAGTSDLSRRLSVQREDETGSLSRSFNTMLDRLEESFENEKRFTSDVSHELRTPVSVIMAESEYMLEKKRSEEDMREGFEVVDRQIRKMDSLINDMLYFSRMDQSPENYEMQRTDLSAIVRDTVFGTSFENVKDIKLSSDIGEGVYISGNGFLLERLVRNLLDNAYRYGRQGGNIYVSLKDTGEKAVLSVKDDGIGIKKEDQEKIFLRFFRADKARNEKGTGLGLAMVKRIAEIHDAEIELESEPGVGSDFKVFFRNL